MNTTIPSKHLTFDPTPEIFATDNAGRFLHELKVTGTSQLDTGAYDEIRFVISLWHPSKRRAIDLDRAYVELDCSWIADEPRWIKMAEIEPVVSPYSPGVTFDGWIVLPIIASMTSYALAGGGFEPRARLQIRVGAYLVT